MLGGHEFAVERQHVQVARGLAILLLAGDDHIVERARRVPSFPVRHGRSRIARCSAARPRPHQHCSCAHRKSHRKWTSVRSPAWRWRPRCVATVRATRVRARSPCAPLPMPNVPDSTPTNMPTTISTMMLRAEPSSAVSPARDSIFCDSVRTACRRIRSFPFITHGSSFHVFRAPILPTCRAQQSADSINFAISAPQRPVRALSRL